MTISPSPNAPPSRGQVALALLDFLKRELGNACVLGDARELPEQIDSDLDIAIPNVVGPKIDTLIVEFARHNGVSLVQLFRHETSGWYYVLAWQGSDRRWLFLCADLCTDYRRVGRLLLTSEALLNSPTGARDRAGTPKPFDVPEPGSAFIYYLMKRVDKNALSKTACDYLSSIYNSGPQACETALDQHWSATWSNRLGDAVRNDDWSDIRQTVPALRSDLHRQHRVGPVEWIVERLRRGMRLWHPTGFILVLTGPDGCGKSAVASALITEISPAFRQTAHYHLKPPGASKTRSGGPPVTDPHGKPPRGIAGSLVKLGWMLSTYWLGTLRHISMARVRSTLVVFERYFHDIVADPRRFRYGGPMLLTRIATALSPQPDLLIVLDASMDTLQSRKQEVPPEESERARQAYLRMASPLVENGRAAIINADQPLEQVVADCAAAVLAHLSRRTAKHLNLPGAA